MRKFKFSSSRTLAFLLAVFMLVGLLPGLANPVQAAQSGSSGSLSSAPADRDALGALGIDSSKAPEGFDPNSTENPYGRDVISMGIVSELYVVGLNKTVVFAETSEGEDKFQAGGTLSNNKSYDKISDNINLQASLYGHEMWEENLSTIINGGTTTPIANGTATGTATHTPISTGTITDANANTIPYEGYITGAENITANLGDFGSYGMSSVAAGNFDKNTDGLQAQAVMVYTADYSAKGGLFLRFGDAQTGVYGSESKTLLSADKEIGNPTLEYEEKIVENFAENPYQLQNYLQVTTGDWNGDGIDEVAVYVPEMGNSRIEIYALSYNEGEGASTLYQNPGNWKLAWTYYLRESGVVSNMVSLVSGDMNKDGTDDLAATWGYYYGPAQNKSSTAVVMFGGKGTEMFKKSQSFPLTYGTSNLVRASFSFGDMAGGSGDQKSLILSAQSDADLQANRPFTRFVALYDWDGTKFVSNVSKNFDLFERDRVNNNAPWNYTYPVMAVGRNEASLRFYSQPLSVANTAVLQRGVGAEGGDLLYFDSLLIEYGDTGLAIKEAWDITGAMQEESASPQDYVEYGAVAGDLTGKTGTSAFFTMTQTLAKKTQHSAEYTLSLATGTEVPNFKSTNTNPWANWIATILRIFLGIQPDGTYVQDGTENVSSGDVTVYYDKFTAGQTYLVAVEPATETTAFSRKEVDSSTSLCLANTDKDTSYMKYGGKHYFAYSDPAVLAVLASPPYFADLMDRDDLSGSYGESSTSYSSSQGTGGSTALSATISLGAYVSFEQEISFFGISAAKVEMETVFTAGFTFETESVSSLEQTVTYTATVGEDMVAFYSIPMEIFEYTTYVPDGKGKYSEVLTTVNIPHEASVRVMPLEDYESIAEDYSVLPKISNNVLTHTVGYPSTYPANTSGFSNVRSYKGDPAAVDYSAAGGSISQEIAMSEETTIGFTASIGLEFKAGAGAGGVTAGVIAGAEVGAGLAVTTTNGSTFSGEIFNMPAEAKEFGYTMNWKIFCYQYDDFPVVSYLVSNVFQPAPLPTDFEQNIAETTADSVMLDWSYDEPLAIAGFNLYRYYEFPDGSGSHQIAYIPFNLGEKGTDGVTRFSYTDTGLSDYTEYKYQIQTVSASLRPKSIPSEPLVCRTRTTKGYPNITIDGLTEGQLPIYPDASAAATAKVADAEQYVSLNYQWQKLEGGKWENLYNQTTDKMTISNAGAGDKGLYRCRVNARYFDPVSHREYSISAYSQVFPTAYAKRDVAGSITASNLTTNEKGLTASVKLYSGTPGHIIAPTGNVLFTITGTDYNFSKAFDLTPSSDTMDVDGTYKYYSTAELTVESLPDGVYTVSAYYAGSKIFKDKEIVQIGTAATVIIGDSESYVIDLRKSTGTNGVAVTNFIYGDEIWPTVSKVSKGSNDEVEISPVANVTYAYQKVTFVYPFLEKSVKFIPGTTLLDTGIYNLVASIGDNGETIASRAFSVNRKPIALYAESRDNVDFGTVESKLPQINSDDLTPGELSALSPDYVVTNSAGNIQANFGNTTPPGNYTISPVAKADAGEALTRLYNNYEITYTPGTYTIIGQTFDLTVEAQEFTDSAGTRVVGTAGISGTPDLTKKYASGTSVVLYAVPQIGYVVDRWTATFNNNTTETKDGDLTWTLTTKAQNVKITVTFKKARPQLSTSVYPEGSGTITWTDESFSSGAYVSPGAEFDFTAVPGTGYHFLRWGTNSTAQPAPTGTDNGDGTNSTSVTAEVYSMLVYAYFARDSYIVTLEGDLQASYQQDEITRTILSGDAVPGDTVITVTPKPGYKAAEGALFALNGVTQDAGFTAFTLLGDTVVSLETTRESYAVTTSAENGSIAVTVNGAAAGAADLESVLGGSALRFVPRATRGFVFEKWMVNGDEKPANPDGSLTIAALSEATNVTAVFKNNTAYTANGKVNLSSRGAMFYTLYDIYGAVVAENQPMPDNLQVYHGEKLVLSVVVNSGSMIEQWQIGSAIDYSTGKSYTFENIGGNINATAFLKAAYDYKVYYTAGEGGTLSAKADGESFASGDFLPGGSELIFKAEPGTGKMLSHWTVTQGGMDAAESGQKVMDGDWPLVLPVLNEYLRSNITVRAHFVDYASYAVSVPPVAENRTAAITYVTPLAAGDDGLTSGYSANVRQNGTVIMAFWADNASFKVDAAKLETVLSGRNFTLTEEEGVYTLTVRNMQEGLTLEEDDIFTALYRVTVSELSAGYVTAEPVLTTEGETVIVTVKPPAGKRLKALKAEIPVENDDPVPVLLAEEVSASRLKYTFTMPAGHVVVAAEFENIPIPPPPPVVPALPTIPAAEGTVQVDYNPDGSTASLVLSAGKQNEIIQNAQNNTADLDLSHTAGITAAEMPQSALAAFAEAGLDVTVILPAGTITFDSESAASVAAKAGSTLRVELKLAAAADLTPAQKEAVKPGDIVADISIFTGEEAIRTFDGSLTVSMPYNGPLPVAVWYLNGAGVLEKLACTFADGIVTFQLDHLSLYVLGEDTDWVNPFIDVKEGDWFYEAVKFVYTRGLMQGVGNSMFLPRGTATRGMIVTILHRLEGTPEPGIANPFDDVPAGKYYAEAVIWAAETGIVSGYGNRKFGPDDNITREQLAQILMNFAHYKGVDTTGRADLLAFADGGKVSGWAKDALAWAVAAGLIQGDGAGLSPAGNAERCQIAAVLQRFTGVLETE